MNGEPIRGECPRLLGCCSSQTSHAGAVSQRAAGHRGPTDQDDRESGIQRPSVFQQEMIFRLWWEKL